MLEQNVQYSAADFIALKNRVKNEMLRRCYEGSIAEYGGSEYDFATAPTVGGQLLTEQINKIIVPISAINDTGLSMKSVGDQAKALDTLVTKIAQFETAPFEGENHGCSASCTGLCHTTCSTGCTGECKTACGQDCTAGCGNSCIGTCTGGCSGGCGGSCGGDCTGQGCMGSCTGYCGGCGGYCGGGCGGSVLG